MKQLVQGRKALEEGIDAIALSDPLQPLAWSRLG